jgi:hypothetical protein
LHALPPDLETNTDAVAGALPILLSEVVATVTVTV